MLLKENSDVGVGVSRAQVEVHLQERLIWQLVCYLFACLWNVTLCSLVEF
jgi:hypothetical protein